MSNCYKNFPITISYESEPTENEYSASVNMSEKLELAHASQIGVKGSNAVYAKALPEGDLNVESYLLGDISVMDNLNASNSQVSSVSFGPYTMPAPALLSSMSVNISVGQPIKTSKTFQFFNGINSTTPPAPGTPDITPAIAENVTLDGFGDLGDLEKIKSITWSFSQEYEKYYLLGAISPTIVYSRGQISMTINGEGLPGELYRRTESDCLPDPESYSVNVFDCDGESLGSLSMEGYLQARTSSVEADGTEQNSLTIIQYL